MADSRPRNAVSGGVEEEEAGERGLQSSSSNGTPYKQVGVSIPR
jgi:hypothetical protein